MNTGGAAVGRHWLPEIVTGIALIAAPWVLPHAGFNADLLGRILIWGLFGLGFDLLFGFTGLLSFGQAAFFGTGGFVTAYLSTTGLVDNGIFCLLIGTLAAMVYGGIIGIFALRRTGLYFAMITLAFGQMSFFLENSPLKEFTGGENGIAGVSVPAFHLGFFDYAFTSGWPLYGFIAAVFWLGFVLARRITYSPFGMIMVSIRENSTRAAALGHKIGRYKFAVFVLAAGYGGLAGGLLGMLQNYMPPGAFELGTSGQLVMQTVIGGAGTLFGPLVGATVWLWLRNVLQYIPDIGAAWKLILGAIFILLVTFARRGLCGELIYWAGRGRRAALPAEDDHATERRFSDADAGSAPARQIELVRGRVAQLDARDDTPALEARGLTKHYGGVHAVTDVSLSIKVGELRALIGPNGAGKSTLFKMLAGEIKPTSGNVYLHGHKVSGVGATGVCQYGLSKSYQINQLFESLTVRQNMLVPVLARSRGPFALDLVKNLRRASRYEQQVQRTLELVGLTERAEWPCGVLAYGEKRRLEIGLALATSPTVLLLDEPLAGMSPAERADTLVLLKRIHQGRTMVVVEHDMDAVFELAEYISVLNEGELLANGTPEQIQGDERVQNAYLGGMDEDELA